MSRLGIPKKDIGIAISEAEDKRSTGFGDRLKNMFSPSEREEYVGANDIETLNEMGVPDREARYYENALRSGGALVTVRPDAANRERAASVLHKCGATLPSELSEEKLRATQPTTAPERQRIQLLGEVLRVHKERVQRGVVSIRKEVITEQQTVEVPVTREELVIERHPASGEPARGDFEHGKEIRVPLSEERVSVEKKPVVREEVEVGKRQVQETKKVSEQVKHEEVDVQGEGKVDLDEKKKRTA